MNNEINDDECHFSYSYNVKAAMEEYAVKSDFFSFGKSAKKNFLLQKSSTVIFALQKSL